MSNSPISKAKVLSNLTEKWLLIKQMFFLMFFQDQQLVSTPNGDVLWEMEYPKAYADVFGSGATWIAERTRESSGKLLFKPWKKQSVKI